MGKDLTWADSLHVSVSFKTVMRQSVSMKTRASGTLIQFRVTDLNVYGFIGLVETLR